MAHVSDRPLGSVAATDFFTVEVATFRRLVTYYVLIVIELSSRKVHIAGITPEPDSAFMMQVGRNLTDPVDGFLLGKRFLILDRDKNQGLENALIEADERVGSLDGNVRCRKRLGGLLNYYHREAA